MSQPTSPGDPLPPVLATPLGPRFAAVRGRPEGWTPATELFGARLAMHLTGLADTLGATPAVAGTLFLQQYATVVGSPVVAALYAERNALPCSPADVSVTVAGDRPVRAAFAQAAAPVAEPERAAPDVAAQLLAGHLLPAADEVHDLTRAGRRVLRGAIANEVAIAFLHLSWRHRDGAHHLTHAREFLSAAGLADLVELAAVDIGGGRWMHAGRRTCCLAFRTARGRDHYCATCPVLPRATVARSFTDAVTDYVRRRDSDQ